LEIITRQLKEIEDINEKFLDNKGVFKSIKLFKCILGLNDLESKIFSYLLKNEKVSTTELTKFFNMDRSSIQRVLQNLFELNLIKRESMSLKRYSIMKSNKELNNRGYLYVYSVREVEYIKNQLTKLLNKWYNSMLNYIHDLDSLFECIELKGELC
jgi:predicted transcriptional regulator